MRNTSNASHYDVLIATIGTSMTNGYVESLTKTIEELTLQGMSYRWLNGFGSLDHNARESTLTGNGLNLNPNDKGPLGDRYTYKKIIWIAPNISWTVKNFMKLYEADDAVVTGAYLLADGVTTTIKRDMSNVCLSKGQILQLKSSGKKQSILSTKFGFLAVKSGVYEKIDRPWHVVFNGLETEEDSWCMKVRDAGFDVKLDPTVLVEAAASGEIKWK